MIVKRLDGTTLYIPREKINHIYFGGEYCGIVTLSIALDYIHGLDSAWQFKVKREEAVRVVTELSDYSDPSFEEGA